MYDTYKQDANMTQLSGMVAILHAGKQIPNAMLKNILAFFQNGSLKLMVIS